MKLHYYGSDDFLKLGKPTRTTRHTHFSVVIMHLMDLLDEATVAATAAVNCLRLRVNSALIVNITRATHKLFHGTRATRYDDVGRCRWAVMQQLGVRVLFASTCAKNLNYIRHCCARMHRERKFLNTLQALGSGVFKLLASLPCPALTTTRAA